MSETSQGPGWWLASDGNWYAPELNSEIHDFEDNNGPVLAHRHPNGGGWVADTASVAQTAFVGPDAAVFVFARVLDYATVTDTAWVLGNAEVSGHARIAGDAEVNGDARVGGEADVGGNAFVADSATVGDRAQLGGDARILDQCTVNGDARVFGNSVISGDVVVSGENRVQGKAPTQTAAMSSHGPGWWQAANGKWYPPHRGPGPPLPRPPSPVDAPPPQFPARRRWKALWITLGAVVVLVLLIVWAGGGSQTTTKVLDSPTTPSTDSPTATTATPSGSGLNQVAKDGTFAFTVTQAQCGLTTLGTSLPQTAPAGAQWCVYTMTVTNDKGSAGDFFAGNQKAIDAFGKQLSADTATLIYMDNASASEFSTINPGVSVNVTVPFQLATGDSIKQLVLHDSAFSGGVTVNVG